MGDARLRATPSDARINSLFSLTPPANSTGNLCLQCGLCCDGTLFRDVELEAGEPTEALVSAGIRLRRFQRTTDGVPEKLQRFSQPCTALGAGCRCAVYDDRPSRCRAFDCALLLAVNSGAVTPTAALRKIRPARALAARARALLKELGDLEEGQPLVRRFQRMQRQFFAGALPPDLEADVAAERFGDLASVVGELQLALRIHFYPESE